jgi:hypothetical protein
MLKVHLTIVESGVSPSRQEVLRISRVPCVGEYLSLEDDKWFQVAAVAHFSLPDSLPENVGRHSDVEAEVFATPGDRDKVTNALYRN